MELWTEFGYWRIQWYLKSTGTTRSPGALRVLLPQQSLSSPVNHHLLSRIKRLGNQSAQPLELGNHCLCHSPHGVSYLNRSNWRSEEQLTGAAPQREAAVSSWLAPFDYVALIARVPKLIKWKIILLSRRVGTGGLRDGHHWWNLWEIAKSKGDKGHICFQWPQDPRCHWEPRARVLLIYFSTTI